MSAKVMTSGEFSSSANQLTSVVLKIQESLGDLLDKYFRALNLPTRRDVERIDERMMAIEDLLHSMGGMLERLAPPPEPASATHVATEAESAHVVEATFTHHVESAPTHHVDASHLPPIDVLADDAPPAEGRKKKRALVVTPPKAKRPPRTKRPAAKKSPST
jgi:hypothetical protein